ncbi:MAG: hypothetical protein AAFZ52_09930 [Bacteroidota bacterium]
MATDLRVQPYPVRSQGPSSYVFTTSYGNTYAISFIRYWQEDLLPIYLGQEFEVYEIYFAVVDMQKKDYDRRIQYTLMHTITEFVSVSNRIGFFDIDREDGRAGELLRVYNIWLKMYERARGETGIMINRVVHIPDKPSAYLACVFHRNNELLRTDNAAGIIDRALTEIFPNSTIRTL